MMEFASTVKIWNNICWNFVLARACFGFLSYPGEISLHTGSRAFVLAEYFVSVDEADVKMFPVWGEGNIT